VNQPRGTQRYQPTQREDEDRLTQAIISLASQYGRYGYRRIMALLQRAGWQVGKDRVERIWRRWVREKRRAKGTAEAEAAWEVVAQRWVVRAAPAGAQEPCVELRLRQREDARWSHRTHAEPDR